MWTLMLSLALAGDTTSPSSQVVVVCPPPLRSTLDPWLEYRRQQGWQLTVLGSAGGKDRIRHQIRSLAASSPVSHVVLVGDVPPAPTSRQGIPTWLLPRQDSPESIASDGPYADFDDDQLPDAAVGRLPVDTRAELAELIRKTLEYEQAGHSGRWRRRINIVAGAGGLGLWTDAMVEAASKRLIAERLPAAWNTTFTYARSHSPYCPDPSSLRDTVLAQLNRGCLFWTYIGHGHPYAVEPLRLPEGEFPLLDVRDTERLACRHGSPIALFFACYCGAFDAPHDCLAEQLLQAPAGPVATVAGTRVTRPYAMAVLAEALMDGYFYSSQPYTLGELLWTAKRSLTAPPADTPHRRALEAVARGLSPQGTSLEAERREHSHLFHLLGDPLLGLPRPTALPLRCAAEPVAGQPLTVTVTAPQEGELILELVLRRDRLPEALRAAPGPPQGPARQARYLRANDRQLATVSQPISAGKQVVTLLVPATAAGACWVRGYLESPHGWCVGAADVQIAAAATTATRRSSPTALRQE